MSKFTIIFQQADEGGYTAYIKEVPGAISEGETLVETSENVLDALIQILAAQAQAELENNELREFPLEVELASTASLRLVTKTRNT